MKIFKFFVSSVAVIGAITCLFFKDIPAATLCMVCFAISVQK